MYMNTTYKAFVAETAAKIAASISSSVDLSNMNVFADEIAHNSVTIAESLASQLEDWWAAKGDSETVMFDVQDSLTSKMEGKLSDIADKVNDLRESVDKVCLHTKDVVREVGYVSNALFTKDED